MNARQEVQLINVCGSAMSGKTGTAKHLGQKLGIKVLDIDDLRDLCFVTKEHDEPTEENRKVHGQWFKSTYRVLPSVLEEQLTAIGRSYILIAGLSIPEGRKNMMDIARKTGARLRIIWACNSPELLSDEEIQKMIDIKCQDPGYAGTLKNVHGVKFVRDHRERFHPITPEEVPGSLVLPTWPTKTVEESYRIALEYCLDPATGFKP